ncbi:HpcH/HpaI aldolase family protein [Vibrio tapetis]|uniref:Achromobactin biosynthetic protein AcsB n=1 Tax=Vibrio tapetis subsp. tapetis TaxID=1671868 RepID=A0A2N8ZHS6_9VIBR|nr:aldolase/citrate lyase family protein [Vibrio tapetis]SON51416.1 Achromobactin biosynthetic protein AcsB [Vibrio tapetis subsp. tapetis]
MLRENQLKQKLKNNETVYGIICSIPAPAMIELIAEAGYDFVIIDMEHVLINPETVENMIRIAESYSITPLVRVADFNVKTILRLLDGGAQGIVLPDVKNATEVLNAIQACKYHPVGHRSLNAGRPGSFGHHSLKQYIQKINDEIMLIAMIESATGVSNIEEIVSTEGLDMILEGAADLSQSLGVPWETSHPKVNDALQYCRKAGKKGEIWYGVIPRTPQDHNTWKDEGMNVFVLGDERGTAFRALRQKIDILKK